MTVKNVITNIEVAKRYMTMQGIEENQYHIVLYLHKESVGLLSYTDDTADTFYGYKIKFIDVLEKERVQVEMYFDVDYESLAELGD